MKKALSYGLIAAMLFGGVIFACSDRKVRIPLIPATDSEGRRPPIPAQGGRFLSERSDAGFS
jgi:hypothetical protein